MTHASQEQIVALDSTQVEIQKEVTTALEFLKSITPKVEVEGVENNVDEAWTSFNKLVKCQVKSQNPAIFLYYVPGVYAKLFLYLTI